jgi:uncharacterized membrane protein
MIKSIYITSALVLIFTLSACTLTPSTPQPQPTSLSIPAVTSTASVAVTPLTLRGTEPFWSFSQTATGLAVYTTPGTGSVEERYYTTTEALVGTDIIITATPQNPADLAISAQVSLGTCSDGMSDIVYPYTVNLSYGLTPYTGCGQ